MSDKTGIEWTDATWNPLRGCSRVSEGCRHCYAEGVARRFSGAGLPYEGLIAKGGQWNGAIKLVPEMLDQPLRWTKPRRIFVNSMSDLFHENVPEDFIDQVFAVMAMAERHTFQVLTKRPERMRDYCQRLQARASEIAQRAVFLWGGVDPDGLYDWVQDRVARGPLPNVWLGVSAEDQLTYDDRVGVLEQTPAAVRWVSLEPMLAAVNANLAMCMNGHGWVTPVVVNNGKDYGCPHCMTVVTRCGSRGPGAFLKSRGIDWIVVGGESGKGARPLHPAWVRALRDQCKAAGVPFLFKQWGEWLPAEAMEVDEEQTLRVQRQIIHGNHANLYVFDDLQQMGRVGKKTAGRLLDARLHDGYPEVRQ